MNKKIVQTRHDRLETDLETVKSGSMSTRKSCMMLDLSHSNPNNWLAGNMYWEALREIIRLRKLLEEKE